MTSPVFTPSAIDPDELDAATVGRAELFSRLVTRITAAARDGSRPHTLLVGPRGSGKTHTLYLTLHRTTSDPSVTKRMLVMALPEDSLAIGSYTDLLVELLSHQGTALAERARALRRTSDVVDLEQEIVDLANGRMILLAIENLDRVFNAIGQAGQGSFRAWVETSSAVMVFATTPSLFSGISSRSFPWYGSFIVEHLPELTVDEGAQMLSAAASARSDAELVDFVRSERGLDRVKVIHRLAGGSPRLWHLVSDCVDVQSLDELVPAVEALLDRLSPYYQQRLWQLPAGEQRLVVELARGWEPRTVSDLAAAVGVSNQSASAALGRLVTTRWVVAAKSGTTDKRASWYDLTEPLLRFHLQYREDRGKPLRLIVEFLRVFYSRDRLMAELAEASPDSLLERHLQSALLSPNPFQLPDGDTLDLSRLVAVLRVWIGGTNRGLVDIASALESVACAAVGRESERSIPSGLRDVVDGAVAAVEATHGSAQRRLQAGMDTLATHDWPPEETDALIWVELIWGTGDFTRKLEKLAGSPALMRRRATDFAINQRILFALILADHRKPADLPGARQTLDHLLDDVDEVSTSSSARFTWVAMAWGYWARTVLGTRPSMPRRVRGPREAGAGFVMAIQRGDIAASDLPAVFAALTPEDISRVAIQIAVAARALDIEFTADTDPMNDVEPQARSEIRRLIEETNVPQIL